MLDGDGVEDGLEFGDEDGRGLSLSFCNVFIKPKPPLNTASFVNSDMSFSEVSSFVFICYRI